MKRFFLAAALALSLAGCTSTGTIGVPGITTSVENPITVRDLAAMTQAYKVALRPAVAYIELRTCSTSKPFVSTNPCGDYATKIVLQNAIRDAQKWRRELSRFVKANRQIDAQVALAELKRALGVMTANAGAQ